MDLVDEGALTIRLERLDPHPQLRRGRLQTCIDSGEGEPAIDLGLAPPEEVQIRPMEDTDP
jgi:hypothetical protein